MGNIGIWQLLIVIFVVVIVFGTKNLKKFGYDLGHAINGFKKAMHEDNENKTPITHQNQDNTGQQK